MFKETTRSGRWGDSLQPTECYGQETPASALSECTFKKGGYLFSEGDLSRGIFFIRSGRVNLSTTLSDGKLVIVEIAGPGAIIGLSSAIDGCEHEVSAQAIDHVSAGFVRAENARSLLRNDPAFARTIQLELVRRYRAAHAMLCTLARSEPVVVRLAALISQWTASGSHDSSRIENVFTHQHIAEMLGTTRETVTRAFRELRDAGLVTLKGHCLEVHDITRLHSLAGVCDDPHRLQ